MALTFRSSIQDEVVLIDRDNAGNQRVLRAVSIGESNNSNRGQWQCHIEEPVYGGGVKKREAGLVCGGRGEAAAGLADLLHRTEINWKQNRASGFRAPSPKRDTSQRVDEFGNPIGAAPITQRR